MLIENTCLMRLCQNGSVMWTLEHHRNHGVMDNWIIHIQKTTCLGSWDSKYSRNFQQKQEDYFRNSITLKTMKQVQDSTNHGRSVNKIKKTHHNNLTR